MTVQWRRNIEGDEMCEGRHAVLYVNVEAVVIGNDIL